MPLNNSVAAADTTATSLSFIIYNCLNKRDVWERLTEEVHGRFKSAEEITDQAAATLPFLDAVIREGSALRV